MLTSRSAAPARVTSSPSSRIWPDEDCSSPAIKRRVEVLPQPLGPSSVTMLFGAIAKETSLTATVLP